MMKRYGAMAALLACASLLAACGREEDEADQAENAQLNNISEVLDTSADSLVAEDPALGNGETGATGEPAAVGSEVANGTAANEM